MNIAKLFASVCLGAAVVGVCAQEAANTIEITSEKRAPKRVVTQRVPNEARALAFAHAVPPEVSSQPLIVTTGKLDPKAADQLREDMAVMARILQKVALEHGNEPEKVLGLDIVVHTGRNVRNLYLDDYGAIFTLNVDMPLKAPRKSEDGEEKKESEVDAEWESARSELFGNKNSPAIRFLERGPRRGYDEKAVYRLRDDLINALRNASNIRNLREDHWVVFVIRGEGAVNRLQRRDIDELFLDGSNEPGESTMVIKARKGEIDRIVKRGAAKEELHKAVQQSIY